MCQARTVLRRVPVYIALARIAAEGWAVGTAVLKDVIAEEEYLLFTFLEILL